MREAQPYNPALSPQPCAEAFGPGPAERCGSCANLRAVHVQRGGNGLVDPFPRDLTTVYYCCIDGAARHVTSPACSRFEEAPLVGVLP
jgi:hypothetical protein